ncbi:MAG: Stk1 family PASTA domain-containing Ser/Thr kinase, partial [Actinobacteria bacterium]|nr:Stk1 family PASTA domain-containing Ser/Thr kinase [Actinomycetota bacterium]
QSAAGLQHPHIVSVFDRGDWDGIPYMAMELIDGVTLKDVIRDQAPLDPVKTIDQISQVLDALRYAHKRGLVHRDIKPQNVLVGPDGDLKVADFGIARAVDDLQMTQTGMIVGTAHYLSPEQASGQPITTSADLYSVGVVLFEMLTGRMPFDGDQPVAIALKHVNEDPPALSIVNPEVPADLEYVVLRSMSKQPEDRFEDAEEFIAALQGVRHRIVSGAPVPAQPQLAAAAAIAQQPTGGWLQPAAGMAVPAGVSPEDARENAEARRRRRWTIAIVGGLAAIVVLALVGYLAFGRMETVSDVRGDTYEAARQKLEGQGFDVTRDQDRASSTVDRGEVIEQAPGDGRKVRRGTEVRLVVSSGPRSATVPSVEGLSLEDARQKLRESGFSRFQESRIANETIAAGRVIATAPAANTTARTGDRIVIQVSQGPATGTTTTETPDQVTVPDLDGLTRARAEAALEAAGLTATFTEQESDEDEGTVIAQQPGSRSQVDEGSNVAVTLATPNADSGGGDASTDVTVPNLEGRTQADATAALRRLGLRPQTRTQTTTTRSENGDVVDQQPNGGKVARGSTVTLVIGVYEAPAPSDPSDTEGDADGGDGASSGQATGPSTRSDAASGRTAGGA